MRRILSGEIGERFDDVRQDPELMHLTDDVALITVRRNELAGALGGRESGETWHQLAESFRGLRKSIEAGDSGRIAEHLRALDAAIREGSSRYARWSDVVTMTHHRAQLVAAETTRALQAQQVLKFTEAETLAAMLEGAVRKNVSDPRILAAIGDDLARAFGREPGKPPEGER